MKQCLQCEKEFDGKRDSAKFCTVNCRVKWNRKNGKKSDIKPIQMQVLYNQILDAVGRIGSQNGLPPPVGAVMPLKSNFSTIVVAEPKVNLQKSFDWYRVAKKEIELPEDWEQMKLEIMASTILSDKQKNLLLTTNY